jgi:hypothetical protein
VKKFIVILFLFWNQNAFAECKFADLEKKANSGDASSLYLTGSIYLDPERTKTWSSAQGCLIKKDVKLGKKYLDLAAKQNYSNALASLGWHYFTGDEGFEKDFTKAIDYNKKAALSRAGAAQYVGAYNIGFFYYTGAGVKQDLGEAAHWFFLSAKQILILIKFEKEKNINRDNFWTKEHPKEILDEINKYNPNPTPEMAKLRDTYINFLKNRDEISLGKLEKLSKYFVESCTKVANFKWAIEESNVYGFHDYKGNFRQNSVRFTFSNPGPKPIKITYVGLETKDGQVIVQQNENAIVAPFTKDLHIGIPKGNLMLELATYGTFKCTYTDELPVQRKTETYPDNQNSSNSYDNSYYKNKSYSKNKKNYSSNRNYNYDAANNYSKPKAEKDPVGSLVMTLGVIATLAVGIYTRSLLMGGGVIFGALSLAVVLTNGPTIILIMGIPATIALFYFGNKEIESRKKK